MPNIRSLYTKAKYQECPACSGSGKEIRNASLIVGKVLVTYQLCHLCHGIGRIMRDGGESSAGSFWKGKESRTDG